MQKILPTSCLFASSIWIIYRQANAGFRSKSSQVVLFCLGNSWSVRRPFCWPFLSNQETAKYVTKSRNYSFKCHTSLSFLKQEMCVANCLARGQYCRRHPEWTSNTPGLVQEKFGGQANVRLQHARPYGSDLVLHGGSRGFPSKSDGETLSL